LMRQQVYFGVNGALLILVLVAIATLLLMAVKGFIVVLRLLMT
jgi:hypothetical protein